ncbi:MAG: hypothetical protein AB7I30_20060 [Isosphaeraceae bacterium]
MTAYTRQLMLVLGTAVVIAVFLYLLIHISEAKLQLLVTVAAVGGGCYAIGLNQDSRFSKAQIDRLEAEKRALEEKVRALKEMYLEDRAAARSSEPAPLSSQDSITLRGGSIRDLFGKLMRGPAVVGQIAPPETSRLGEPVENGTSQVH